MANRLMQVIHKLIAGDQTGSIRGRYIGTNLRTVDDVIRYCESDKLSGIVMALDFKNAFNSVEHYFIYDVLRKFNFGNNFVEWIKLLHNNAELTVINNGYTSKWFKPSRGLQQGCPASALLFTLVVEIMAIKLRAAPMINGIQISGKQFKLSQYCDDTTLFVRDSNSATEAIKLIEEFGTISGLELNFDKCQFMWIGEERDSEVQICGRTPVRQLKILGIEFSASLNCEDSNMQTITNRIQNTLNRWSQRDMTIKGRITIAKSLVVSQMIYVMSASLIKKKHLENIQSKIMKFLWRGRPPKVARDTMYQKIEAGGLEAPNTMTIYKAMRVSWIGKIVINQEMTFAKVLLERLRIKASDLTQINYHKGWIKLQPIAEFYKEMLIWFREAIPVKVPENGTAVRQQIIWLNKEICIDRKCVLYGRLYNQDIKYIDDFTDSQGRLMKHSDFRERHNVYIDQLRYMGLLRAIPAEWKRKLLGSHALSTTEKSTLSYIEISGKRIPIQSVKPKFYHGAWTRARPPRCQFKWESEGVMFENNWKEVYKLPFKITSSTKLQSLQHRIIHRYFPTRRFLCIRGVIDDPFCNECGEIETIKHYFAECHDISVFWGKVTEKINQKLEQPHRFQNCSNNIIFGMPKNRSIVNLIVLIAKQFIVTRRFKEERICWDDFLPFLTQYFLMEKVTAIKKERVDKLKEKWESFLTPDLQISF